jgi:NADH:ubiquinone oxidoreductase subunit B-like Fe-S oxidoreductase
MNEILIFVLFISAIIFISFRLGKERGTMLASERAVDIMIAMGYLKEKTNGEIEKVDDEKSN